MKIYTIRLHQSGYWDTLSEYDGDIPSLVFEWHDPHNDDLDIRCVSKKGVSWDYIAIFGGSDSVYFLTEQDANSALADINERREEDEYYDSMAVECLDTETLDKRAHSSSFLAWLKEVEESEQRIRRIP